MQAMLLASADSVLHCRREEREQARGAQAFEAASQAKALVQTWKKPRVGPGSTSLPAELWGLVLERMLTEASLWDLRATVQQLCHVSLACKGLYSTVQQQGWPKLCRLLKPLWQPPSIRQAKVKRRNCQLPDDPDLLVSNPAGLQVPELKAACAYFGMPLSGESASAHSMPCICPSMTLGPQWASGYVPTILFGPLGT